MMSKMSKLVLLIISAILLSGCDTTMLLDDSGYSVREVVHYIEPSPIQDYRNGRYSTYNPNHTYYITNMSGRYYMKMSDGSYLPIDNVVRPKRRYRCQ